MGFTEDVEQLRSKRIIVQDKDIIARTGYKKSTISNYLSGKVSPSKPFLKKFYEVYSLDLGMNKVFASKLYDKNNMLELEKENMRLEESLIDKNKLIGLYEHEIRNLKKQLAHTAKSKSS